MNALLLIMLLSAPIVPRNPAAQDTVAESNIHFTLGLRPGTDMTGLAPEAGLRLEYLLLHPLILRTAFDYSSARVDHPRFPSGRKSSGELSAEIIAYRGLKRFTAYLGFGLVYSLNGFDLEKQLTDPLLDPEEIIKTAIENDLGYRLIFGLRRHVRWSFEIGYQFTRPEFSFKTAKDKNRYTYIYKKSDFSTVRVTFGYLIPF